MCVENAEHIPGSEHAPTPIVGNVYSVLDAGWDEDLGDYYCLVEFGSRFGYSQRHFAILPEPDADQLTEEEETAIVNLQPA
jgi:hypothetical protein